MALIPSVSMAQDRNRAMNFSINSRGMIRSGSVRKYVYMPGTYQ